MKLRLLVRSIHKWLSLAMLLPWILQASAGVILVFHFELDDWSLRAPPVATDLTALQRRVAALATNSPGSVVASLRTTAGTPNRYDIRVEALGTGEATVVRVDGAGDVLRVRTHDETLADGGLFRLINGFHQTFLLGDSWGWVIGFSGILLLTNLLLGLQAAWPARSAWRAALWPARPKAPRVALYAWHRAIGLWLVVPAIVMVACGTALVFHEQLNRLLGSSVQGPTAEPGWHGAPEISMVAAVAKARELHAGASFVGVEFPMAGAPWYVVTLRQPEEATRAYGSTQVYIDARDAGIVAHVDPVAMPAAERALDAVYPIHTGEAGGLAGRIVTLLTGASLATLMIVGLILWWTRRTARRTAPLRAAFTSPQPLREGRAHE